MIHGSVLLRLVPSGLRTYGGQFSNLSMHPAGLDLPSLAGIRKDQVIPLLEH